MQPVNSLDRMDTERTVAMTPGHWTLAMLAPVMLLAVGCTGVIEGEPDAVNPYPKITLNDPQLQDGLAFNPATVTRTETGMLAVSQPIRATANEPLMIEYRFVWLDSLGAPIRPQTGWVFKRLEPRLPDTIAANSTSADAVDYQIHLRWARP